MIINTTVGPRHEASLVKTTGRDPGQGCHVEWVEYRLPFSREVVHRSARVVIHEGVQVGIGAAGIKAGAD